MAHRAARHGENLVCSRIISKFFYLCHKANFVDAYTAVGVLTLHELYSHQVWEVLDGQSTPQKIKSRQMPVKNALDMGQGGCFGVPHRAAPFGNIFSFIFFRIRPEATKNRPETQIIYLVNSK